MYVLIASYGQQLGIYQTIDGKKFEKLHGDITEAGLPQYPPVNKVLHEHTI